MKKLIILLFIWMGIAALSMDISYKDQNFRRTQSPEEEFRGVWVASVINLNWPSRKDLSVEEQKAEYLKILDEVEYMNMNAVIVQVRPAGDALYHSSLAPWSAYLTGKQGVDPGYDPLEFMIEEAHKRGIEFHAWFNPFRIAVNQKEFQGMSRDNYAVKNPDTVIKYGSKYYLDAGMPKVREHILDVFLEVVRHYDIDAVHIDDYFYPYTVGGEAFPDDKTYAKYGKGYKDIDAWRRGNINKFIESLSKGIKAEKPEVDFGVSPFGVWRNSSVDSRGSATRASQTSYDNLHADILHWIDEGWIDYVIPQIYWNFGFDAAPYEVLVDWWVDATAGKDVKLYIGQGAYKMDTAGWEDPDELIKQIHYNRNRNVKGSAFFSINSLMYAKNDIVERIRRDIYTREAEIPEKENN